MHAENRHVKRHVERHSVLATNAPETTYPVLYLVTSSTLVNTEVEINHGQSHLFTAIPAKHERVLGRARQALRVVRCAKSLSHRRQRLTARRTTRWVTPREFEFQRVNRKTAVLAIRLGSARTSRPSCRPKLSAMRNPQLRASTSKSA